MGNFKTNDSSFSGNSFRMPVGGFVRIWMQSLARHDSNYEVCEDSNALPSSHESSYGDCQ
jgi:hypothetical protein